MNILQRKLHVKLPTISIYLLMNAFVADEVKTDKYAVCSLP